jgi:hypothetical protein
MRTDHVDPADERPEADVLEQASEASSDDDRPATPSARRRFTEADDADLLDQDTPVPGDDADGYPYGSE